MCKTFTPNKFRVFKNTIRLCIKRNDGERFIVLLSVEDIWILAKWRIGVDKRKTDGKVCVRAYGSKINGKRPKLLLSRLVMNCNSELVVDHINCNALDNRRENLRLATISENAQNRKGATRLSKSGVRGVYWNHKKQKWIASCRVGGFTVYEGVFDSLEEANREVKIQRAKHMPYSKEAAEKRGLFKCPMSYSNVILKK